MFHPDQLRAVLEAVQTGQQPVEEAIQALSAPQAAALDFAELDLHRPARTGHPEAVYGAGKTAEQVIAILQRFEQAGQTGLVTRVAPDMAAAVVDALPAVEWLPVPRLLVLRAGPAPTPVGALTVVCAGTSDLPVAEEAAVTAELLGNRVHRIVDVGVAGLHRILSRVDALQQAQVVVVVAGMEGALASVVAGLVRCPVVAVPTSVGYGAAFGGVAALLGMLNSCAPGVSVVNIDNGYGAAITASRVNHAAARGA
jgi:NCAIR mutase (PurE)-related protein